MTRTRRVALSTGFVTVSVLRLLARAVGTIAPGEVARFIADLPAGFDTDQDLLVPRGAVDAAWVSALARTGHPALGLAIGSQVSPTAFGLLGYVTLNADTLGDAYDLLLHYNNLLQQGASHWAVAVVPGGRRFRFELLPPRCTASGHITDFVLTSFLRAGTHLVGPFRPLAVRLKHAAHGPVDAYSKALGCRVVFGAEHNDLVVASADLGRRVRDADRALHGLLVELVKSRPDSTPQTTRDRVVGCLRRGLGTRPADSDSVARELSMSPRSLRRRLAQEGATFSACLDEVRFELAKHYLKDPRLSASEVALLVGFTDTTSLYRGFQRWAGVSLREYRARDERA